MNREGGIKTSHLRAELIWGGCERGPIIKDWVYIYKPLFIFFAKSPTNIRFKWDPTGDSAVNDCHYKLEAKQGGIKSHCRYFNNIIYIASFL